MHCKCRNQNIFNFSSRKTNSWTTWSPTKKVIIVNHLGKSKYSWEPWSNCLHQENFKVRDMNSFPLQGLSVSQGLDRQRYVVHFCQSVEWEVLKSKLIDWDSVILSTQLLIGGLKAEAKTNPNTDYSHLARPQIKARLVLLKVHTSLWDSSFGFSVVSPAHKSSIFFPATVPLSLVCYC